MKLDYSDKIAGLFLLFTFFVLIFIVRVIYIAINEPKQSVSTTYTKKEFALRGEIFSKDNFTVSTSKKVYSVAISPQFISPNKQDILIDMLSIYTDKPKEYFKKKLNTDSRIILLKKISSKMAKNLQYLSSVLDMKQVFLTTSKGIRLGLEIYEEPFKRVYNYNDTLEPILGVYRLNIKKGVSGIEEFYNQALKEKKNSFVKGLRDLKNRIIIDKNAQLEGLINGDDLVLNIDLSIQRKIELILDKYQKELNSTEIIAGVMNSKTGEMLALASSKRYNPNFIKQEDVPNIKISAIRYSFEAGSVFKPITLALLLENNKTNIYEVVNAHNGYYKPSWRKTPILDEHRYKWLSVENAIVHSSNIVTAQIAQKLTAKEFYFGLKKFGFTKSSGVDLSGEVVGEMPSIKEFEFEIYKGTVAYGYAIKSNFLQILKVYSAFNHNGLSISPTIVNRFKNIIIKKEPIKIMSQKTALTIKKILRKTVLQGTGVDAQVDGIYVGGKTGTAHISSEGAYKELYNSSFFGFANDEKSSYTIGVTVIKPTTKYFASQTAVPVFREVVEVLVNNSYLIPNNVLK
jgi:cell division protein FtsI (penicillin-binding protein 3)